MIYDYSQWHPKCGIKDIIVAPDGLHVHCPKCQVSANLEAISGKISAEDSFLLLAEQRTLKGKLSPGVAFAGKREVK